MPARSTTADVLDRSQHIFFDRLPPLSLKGKTKPVTAFNVGSILGTRGRRDRESPRSSAGGRN